MPDGSSKKHKILLVDDDLVTGEAIASSLNCFEFITQHVETGAACLNALHNELPMMVLLDIHLPDSPGYDVCKKIRVNFTDLPIIALSGTQDDADIVRMLESGCDDFVAKKSTVAILIAHMRSALNRIQRQTGPSRTSADTISWGPISLDRSGWKVTVEGQPVAMTLTELRLLETLLSSPGAVFTRDQLIDRLHGESYSITPRTIDVHINGIRTHLGKFRSHLETVRGIGYRFAEFPNDL